MSDTDYMPSHMDSINETQSGYDSPVFVDTATTQTRRKNRAKKKQNLKQEQQSALRSAIQACRARKRERDGSSSSDSSRSPFPPKKKGRTITGPVWKATNRDEPKNDLIPNIFDEVPLAQISETDIQGVDNIPVWYEYKNNSLLDNDSIITYNCGCGGSSKSDLEECCTTDGESVDYCAKMAQ